MRHCLMKICRAVCLLLLGVVAFSLEAAAVDGLAPSAYCDTEASTNVAFCAGGEEVRRFCLSLGVAAACSNNLEVAFDCDANANGVLERAETDLQVGWDAGAWFFRDRRGGVARRALRSDGARTLDWRVSLDAARVPVALSAQDADGAMFEGDVPSTLFDSGWNLMRVTVRGISGPDGLAVAWVEGMGFQVILR